MSSFGNYLRGGQSFGYGRGNRAHAERIGNLVVYFSYRTPVAFDDGGNIAVSKNMWGVTTGGHLNAIDAQYGRSREQRISRAEFEHLYHLMLRKHGLE